MFGALVKTVFGSSNDRYVKSIDKSTRLSRKSMSWRLTSKR